MHEHREVRVTPRRSVRTPFVAPELSPVRTVDSEIDKGTKGWTDFDKKVPDLRGEHLPQGFAERHLDALKVGTVIRKAPRQARVTSSNGPSAHYRAMQAKASRLA